MEQFAGYGFNKSHSAAYAWLAYQTAWLKANHPSFFLAALLTSERANTDKMVQYIGECREMGVRVLPPDVNQSDMFFTVVPAASGAGSAASSDIRFGLSALKNVGEGAVEAVLEARRSGGPFHSLFDFCDRVDGRAVNRRVIESFVKSGTFDGLEARRSALYAAIEPAMESGQKRQRDRESGQSSLFGGPDAAAAATGGTERVADAPPWSEAERLAFEKESLGFFISGHPLERFREEVELFGTRTTATLGEWSEHPVTVGAIVTMVKRQISKKTGKEYARLVLEDFHGTAEAIVFPDAWAKLNGVIFPDTSLLLTGGYSERDRGEDHAPFIVESARPLEELKVSGAVALSFRWRTPAAPPADALRAAAALCSAHPGPTPLYIEWSDGNGEDVRLRSRRLRITAEENLVRALRDLLGADSVHYIKAG
jgi:DNA polymerase-3 subunit alpha